MIDTSVSLVKHEEPYPHYTGTGILSVETVKELNATPPERRLYKREIKSGSQYRKEYTMWRCEPVLNGLRTPVADALPPVWSNLIDGVRSVEFRSWLSTEMGLDLTPCPLTCGLYILEDGDFTTTDTGKAEKLVSFALYLNEVWEPSWGGQYQMFTGKAETKPVREIVPVGGTCVARTPSKANWHRIQPVNTGGRAARNMMMVEFWRV